MGSAAGDWQAITWDEMGTAEEGYMVRFLSTSVGDDAYEKVISMTPPLTPLSHVRGQYSLDDVQDHLDLEWRADVVLRCPDGGPSCTARVAFQFGDLTLGGLHVEYEDYDLTSQQAPISVDIGLGILATSSNPGIGFLAERTDVEAGPSPEILIVNPRWCGRRPEHRAVRRSRRRRWRWPVR